MRVRFYVSESKDRESNVAEAFGKAVIAGRDEFEMISTSSFAPDAPVKPDARVDVACVFALKGAAKAILDGYASMGKRTLLFDKGLIRGSTGLGAPAGYYRVTLDTFMPLARIERMMREGVSPERWIATGVKPLPFIDHGTDGRIIYCGSSQKYCDFMGLGDEHEYAEAICTKIRKAVGKSRIIVYRPKPSFGLAQPIKGTLYSRPPNSRGEGIPIGFPVTFGSLGNLLARGHALVTHGSHAGIDAILGGVPAVVLGPGAARPVANTDLSALREGTLKFPDAEERSRWLAAIGWWQWKIDEMQDGSMWRFLRSEMDRPVEPILEPEEIEGEASALQDC